MKACYTQEDSIPELLERLEEVSEWSFELFGDSDKNNCSYKKFRFSLNIEYA